MRRGLLLTSLLALASVALAGCISQGGEPLRPAAIVGGSATVPDVVAEGAEVIKHADAVELVWKGQAGFVSGVSGVAVSGTPIAVGGAEVHTYTFELPVEVTLVEAALAWTNGDVNLNLFVRDEDGRTQCRSAFGVEDEPATEYCKVYKVAPREAPQKWTALVSVLSNQGGLTDPEPFELRLNLVVRPFELLGPALPAELRSPALGFWATRVDEERRTGEPSLKADGEGNVYIAAPTGKMQSLWRTRDGGATFEWIDIMAGARDPLGMAWNQPRVGRGGGDAEVFVTEDGQELYFADLWGTCMSVGSSMNQGESWQVNPLSCELPGTDRQWLWAQPGGHLWMTFNGASVGLNVCRATSDQCGGLLVMHSIDAGRTWPFRVYVPEDQCARGNIAVDEDFRWYVGGCNDAGPGVAVGVPSSSEYAWRTVAERSGEPLAGFCYVCGIFSVVDLDTEGNPYVVWADPSEDEEGFDVWMSASTDQGETWSAPAKVNKGVGNALLPWIAALEPGHVSIAWYQTAAKGSPDELGGEWYVHLAESTNALEAQPAFAEALVWDTPVQYGPLCIRGSGCQSARNLLDFLMVDIDHHGVSHVAFVDGGHGGSAGNSFIMYARMTGGLAVMPEDEHGGEEGHAAGAPRSASRAP